ncbi:SAGA complex subunit Sgf73 [Spiromyces aspiralis]|uniref:SAGA complex subunit Sgf73 n=1 Tax=Spiromyces aspiralis TaxID=68401 RepID=A0ACC1HI68_9FUNG|nr:SAGA complex subunit Sgf73 [Spiromyces aspiralis]
MPYDTDTEDLFGDDSDTSIASRGRTGSVLHRAEPDALVLVAEIENLKRGDSSSRLDARYNEGVSTPHALLVFKSREDWKPLAVSGGYPKPSNLTWEQIKKAVAEEDKYQSKKNWSSTKGKGNRKSPIVRRLDLDSLRAFGVMPLEQYPSIAICDSCCRPVNAQNLKEHQLVFCHVSEAKSDRKAHGATKASATPGTGGRKRTVSEVGDSDEHHVGEKRVTAREAQKLRAEKRAKLKQEKREQRERERKAKRESAKVAAAKASAGGGAKEKAPIDLDKQCGVLVPPNNQPCSRSLTCKTHSMAAKRAVRGRSQLFDVLLRAHLAKSRSAAAAKSMVAKSGQTASAVRNATALALGGSVNGALADGLFEDSDSDDHDSDSEAERLIEAAKRSSVIVMATRPCFMPRRRHRYLRIRDLLADALKPNPVVKAAAASVPTASSSIAAWQQQ